MSEAGDTSATTLRFLTEALDTLGVDTAELLRRCEIDPASIVDPEARIPANRIDRVWKTASVLADDPCIGLHAGERIRPHAVNLFGYLMLSSPTIGDGIRRVAHYQAVLTGTPWIVVEDGGSGIRVGVGLAHEDPDTRAIHAEYCAALVLQVMEWVSERVIAPTQIRFAHEARGDPAEYRRVLRGPVRFGAPRSELELGSDQLAVPSLHANARFAQLHEEFATELLAAREDTSLAGRVRKLLAERLEHGPPDRVSLARQLGMSDRTLQRRLHEEGTSFRSILDEWRRDLTREYLQRRGAPIAEVAYLTGFAEVSSFTRAVRRWFDCTPSQLRLRRDRC